MSLNAVDANIVVANETAKFAKKNAPQGVKNALTDVKHVGESGVRAITDSKLGQMVGAKTDELARKVRTGKALSFTKSIIDKGAGGIKTLGELGGADKITQLMIILLGCIFFIMALWCYNKLSLNTKNCKKLTSLYSNFPLISSINSTNPIYQYKLRDYFIKTAYNCCSGGNFKNDFVNLCALKNCIKQGARCLDFEIYSVNNIPVVAVSGKSDFNVKESYNNIAFANAMSIVSTYAFSGNTCPNANDPLILHFRIMSNIPDLHEQMSMILYNTLSDRLLGKGFSYESTGRNLGSYGPISNLMGKVIIMVDKSNPLFMSTKLNEYVNIASNSMFVRNLRFTAVKFCPDANELTNYNKPNMTIVLPDLSATNNNYSSDVAMSYGCQMVAMSFQNFDPYMERYTQMFDDAGSAFILRPDDYRYIPIFIVKPPPQNPNYSYENRTTPVLDGIKPLIL
jgi:hypothetical protein